MKIHLTKQHDKYITISDYDDLLPYKEAGWTIASVNNKSLIGYCNNCERPILEQDDYFEDHQGNLLCKSCIGFTQTLTLVR